MKNDEENKIFQIIFEKFLILIFLLKREQKNFSFQQKSGFKKSETSLESFLFFVFS